MATQSPAPPTPPDEKRQTQDGNEQDIKGETANDSSEKPVFAISEPMREDQVQNAVKFLSHPRVKGSPVMYRRSFLEKKGLTKEEIDEAFRRVPDPPPSATKPEVATTNQTSQNVLTTAVQHQTPIQTPQPAVTLVNGTSIAPMPQQHKFQWSHALLAATVLACSGAGTAVFFKKVFIPRLKSWIRKVASEKSENEKEYKPTPNLAEEAAEAAKAAASAAAIVAKASQELLNSRNEEKKYFEAFKDMIDVQVKEMKSMGQAIRNLETKDKLIEEHAHTAAGNGSTNNPWRTSTHNQTDAGVSSMFSKHAKMNGTPNGDFGAARSSSAPASIEPVTAPHPKSYMDIMAMVQRGEIPPGIEKVNDMPPNPNQPPSKPLLAPRPKPWEVTQQRPSYAMQSQSSSEEYNFNAYDNGLTSQMINGKAVDATEPWLKKAVKITEIDSETETKQQLAYSTGSSERSIQRTWVPPQPPSVVMPEAAAAIRQPKSSVQKQQLSDERSTVHSGAGEEEGVGRSSEPVVEVETTTDMTQTEIQEEMATTNGVEV